MATTRQAEETPDRGERAGVREHRRLRGGERRPRRYFTIPGRDPFEEVEWELRHAFIPGKDGPAFEQKDVEFPKFWSQTATNIVAQKYFPRPHGLPERERSVKQMIGRVVDTIGGWGREGGYFATDDEADTFEAELKAILLQQYASFNSPVWFNVGFEAKPRCSACFILSIDDSMVDPRLDPARGLSSATAPAPGSTSAASAPRRSSSRRATRLRAGVLHARRRRLRRHDQVGRQDAARGEDGRARHRPPGRRGVHLVQGEGGAQGARPSSRPATTYPSTRPTGFDPVPEREQPVRVTDAFLEAVVEGKEWNLTARTDGSVVETTDARSLLRQMAEAAWECADPGSVRHDDQHLAHAPEHEPHQRLEPVLGVHVHRRRACSTSLSLLKFRKEDGELDIEAFEHAVDVVFLAQEIAVGYSSYPTSEIDKNAKEYRQLGLGYANLGALLMARGLHVRLRRGRAYAAAITHALMTGRAYRKSRPRSRSGWARSPAIGRTRRP